MRQTHASNKKLFVDDAGDSVLVVVGRLTCETRAAQIFVAVLGASRCIYAEATSTRCLILILMLTGTLSGATGGSGRRPPPLSAVTGFLSGQPAGCKGNGAERRAMIITAAPRWGIAQNSPAAMLMARASTTVLNR